VDSTALLAAIFGAAYGAMVAYRLLKGQRWTAVGLIAFGSMTLLNLVTIGHGTHLEHRIILAINLALLITFIAVSDRASQERQRGLISIFRWRVGGRR
jgi:hypothetical protein